MVDWETPIAIGTGCKSLTCSFVSAVLTWPTVSPSSAANRPITTGVAMSRLSVTTGSTRSPTSTCPPRAMMRPRVGDRGTVWC
jgi:hypothetical protein